MKKLWLHLSLLALVAQMPLAIAQEEDASAETEAPAQGGLSAGGADTAFGDIGLKKLEADVMSSGATGDWKLSGAVILESDQLNLNCADLNVDPESKKITAKGSPVKIVQGGVRAEWKSFTYNMDTKNSRLEGSPVIYQTKGDQTTKTRAGIITITQNKNGEASFNFEQGPEGIRPTIEIVNNAAPKSSPKPASQKTPKPLDTKDDKALLDIKLPAAD